MTITSERAERVAPGAVLHAGERELVIATSRRHQDRWLIRFEGFEDRTTAEALSGAVLSGDEIDPAGDDVALWVDDVVGAEVRDRTGTVLGRVTAVQANPAHDLLVLDGGALVPAPFVVEHQPGLVVVEVPPGLLDVNRSE